MLNISEQELVSIFGLRNTSRSGDNIVCSCPIPGQHKNGDRNPSFSINALNGLWICFAAGTGVITSEGVKPIEALVGKEVEIINGNCEWEKTSFVNCGRQQLWKLTLARDRQEKIVYVTKEHEWIVHGRNNKVPTYKLKKGYRLEGIKSGMCNSIPSRLGLQHGFIYGDGTLTSRSQNGNYHHHVYAMTETKADFVKENFDKWKEPVSKAGAYLGASLSVPFNMKEMPSPKMDKDYLMGFVCGLFAADGSADLNRFFNANREEIEKLCTLLEVLGIPHGTILSQTRAENANFGCVNYDGEHTMYSVSIYEKLTPDIFYQTSKRIPKKAKYARTGWTVASVEETARFEDVYCCETSTHSFFLEDYLLTGNCFGCGHQGNIYQLAELVLGMSSFEAHQKFDGDITPDAVDQMMSGREVERKALTPLQMDISRWVADKHEYWHQRGFTDETIGKFQLGYSKEMNRVVVPIYFKKELVGWTARQLDPYDHPKWKNSPDLKKSEILYGMDKFSGDSCVLVEAPLSVVMLDQHGVSNAVASFGCKLSDAQARLLRSSYNNVLVFYDPDEAGQDGMRKAVSMLEDFMDVYVAPITRDDPAAMSLEENLSALRQAEPAWMLGMSGRG